MANRFVLNNISYHGAGAIQEIPGELIRRDSQKRLWRPTPTWCVSASRKR